MPKYQPKPLPVDAVVWDGSDAALEQIQQWMGPERQAMKARVGTGVLVIPTPGAMLGAPYGHYVIRNSVGDLSVCDPNVFQKTYRPEPERRPEDGWRHLGDAAVDSGMLLVGDPCYFWGARVAGHGTFGRRSTAHEVYPDYRALLGFIEQVDYSPVQLHFPKGHPGLAVIAPTAHGDGSYPVLGYYAGGRCVTMMVVTDPDYDPRG